MNYSSNREGIKFAQIAGRFDAHRVQSAIHTTRNNVKFTTGPSEGRSGLVTMYHSPHGQEAFMPMKKRRNDVDDSGSDIEYSAPLSKTNFSSSTRFKEGTRSKVFSKHSSLLAKLRK